MRDNIRKYLRPRPEDAIIKDFLAYSFERLEVTYDEKGGMTIPAYFMHRGDLHNWVNYLCAKLNIKGYTRPVDYVLHGVQWADGTKRLDAILDKMYITFHAAGLTLRSGQPIPHSVNKFFCKPNAAVMAGTATGEEMEEYVGHYLLRRKLMLLDSIINEPGE